MRYLFLTLLLTAGLSLPGSTSELSTEHVCVDIGRSIKEAQSRGELSSNQADELIRRCYKSFR
jgi:hypothetical protein